MSGCSLGDPWPSGAYESRILLPRPQSAGVVATDVIDMGLVSLTYRLHGYS